MVWHRTDTYKNIPYKINLDQSNFVESVPVASIDNNISTYVRMRGWHHPRYRYVLYSTNTGTCTYWYLLGFPAY